jgi:hypothetical protein
LIAPSLGKSKIALLFAMHPPHGEQSEHAAKLASWKLHSWRAPAYPASIVLSQPCGLACIAYTTQTRRYAGHVGQF